ncbi:P-loop containing nucleoside triphosphate hydrolase [Cryptosporidium felis]|nr:P-loop containing nucleoside triphosphate hydrolase [Cryptosporidium felis]
MENSAYGSINLLNILELDEETEAILERSEIKTVPQLLLENLKNKGLRKEQQSKIYHKCRERITSFPKSLSDDFRNLNFGSASIDPGFKLGTKLMDEARANWTQNGELDSKINFGSEELMNFFDGGLILGETTEFFGQDLPVIRRVVHWIISNTLFSSKMKALSSESQSENSHSYQAIYVQTTNNSFDPIFMKKCFQKLCGELEATQNSQFFAEISHDLELLLSNINVITVSDHLQLQNLLCNLPAIKEEMKELKLIVIDPISSLIASHLFIEDQELQSGHFREIRDKIFVLGRLLRYACKVLSISSIVLSLAKQPPKQNSYILNYCSTQLLSNVGFPTSVSFQGLGTFNIPPPTKIFSTEIDYNWILSPHNRILIENITNAKPENRAGNILPYAQEPPHTHKLLRWTIFKSNRLPVGKYTCVLLDRIGFVDSNCQFL